MKKKLIHLLGGVTLAESKESDHNSAMIGRVGALVAVQDKLKQLYGMPADRQLTEISKYLIQEQENIRMESSL